ncbi:MAG: hypothetical protein WBC70_14645 [Candidatus Aminicenantales bacterium]
MQKKRDPRPYVGLHKEVIFGCPEWAALSPRAKSLYLLLKGKRNPKKNNGNVTLSYREIIRLSYAGLKRPETISQTYSELEKAEWIKRVDEGGGLYGNRTTYELSGQFDQYGLAK